MRHGNAPKASWFDAARLATYQLQLTAFQLADTSVTTGSELLTKQVASWVGIEAFWTPVRFHENQAVRADKFADVAVKGFYVGPCPTNPTNAWVYDGRRHREASGGLQVFGDFVYNTNVADDRAELTADGTAPRPVSDVVAPPQKPAPPAPSP